MSRTKRYNTLFIVRDRDLTAATSVTKKISTELNLIYAAYDRGHNVSVLSPEDFYVKSGEVWGITKRPNAEKVSSLESLSEYLCDSKHRLDEAKRLENFDIIYSRFTYRTPTKEETESMKSFAGGSSYMAPLTELVDLMIEKNSFDTSLSYLVNLEMLKPKMAMINSPLGIQVAGPKVYDTLILHEHLPETHITRSKTRIKKIIKEAAGNVLVVKPIEGMGGKGVYEIKKMAQSERANQSIELYGNAMIQKKIEGVDRRLYVLNGEIVGGFKKIPLEGEIVTNISLGGTAAPYKIQDVDKQIVSDIKGRILREGLYFCGLDIMGPETKGTIENTKLIELNVRCPSGLSNLETIIREEVSSKILEFGEKLYEKNKKKRIKKIN